MSNELVIITGQVEQTDGGRAFTTILAKESSDKRESVHSLLKKAELISYDIEPTFIKTPERVDSKELMVRYARTPNDTNDPSYTQLKVPYSVVCRERYQKARAKHNAQFIKELKMHELLRDKALDGVRIHRSQQSGFISIFYSVGSNPLALWDKQVKNGHIRRVIDDEVKSLVLDVGGTNVATTYITCPIKPRASMGVKLPYLVMVIKNMKKYFSFEIQILDDKEMRRRFRVSNFQSTTKVRPFCTTMPIGLSSGWNQVQFNLADFTKRAYGSVYLETVRVQIHANVRIRRIYFTDQLHSDEDLPNEFKLFAPGGRDQKGKGKEKKPSKEALEAAQAEAAVPHLKTELKPDEEVPPPPTPAEESPVAKEEGEEAAEAPTEPEVVAEGEAGEAAAAEAPSGEVAEGEAPPTEEGAEGAKVEGEEEKPAEGEGAAPDTEASEGPPEGGVETSVDTEGAAAPTDEAAAGEGQEAPPEGAEVAEGETPAEGAEQVEEAAPAEAEAPVETVVEETVVEQSEVVVEMTEETVTEVTTEVTDTEASPSEPATTDNEGEEA